MAYSHVTGGVVSGSGKGVTAITVGLLKACGRRVTPIKIDPYLNTTMPPFEHGGYVDLSRGICKRFLHIKLTRDNYITGKIYEHVIAKKRDGDYLGKTVQGLRSHVGGTTHLGSGKSFFNVKDGKSEKLYDAKNFVDERHRHRHEVNHDMVERQEKADLSLAAKDEIMKPVDDMRSPKNEQENCSDYRPKKSKHTRRTIPSKQEVKEDLLKTQKKGIFITEEAVKRNHKNPPYIYLINTIITLLAFIIIKLVSLEMATTRFSFRSGRRSTTYSSSSLRFDADSCPPSSEGQANPNLTSSPVSYPMRIPDSPGKVHQVFLNFRGEQLRYNLVSHVMDGLRRHGIKFFIDEFELRSNDLDHLFVRIEESSIALAFFSTRYTESEFCMDELVKMKERVDQGKLRVIPIFCKVKAEDVRIPTHDSEFGRNFWKLAESNADKVKAWTEALGSISKMTGLSFREKSSESDFVYKIVNEVKRLKEAIELEEEEKPFSGEN